MAAEEGGGEKRCTSTPATSSPQTAPESASRTVTMRRVIPSVGDVGDSSSERTLTTTPSCHRREAAWAVPTAFGCRNSTEQPAANNASDGTAPAGRCPVETPGATTVGAAVTAAAGGTGATDGTATFDAGGATGDAVAGGLVGSAETGGGAFGGGAAAGGGGAATGGGAFGGGAAAGGGGGAAAGGGGGAATGGGAFGGGAAGGASTGDTLTSLPSSFARNAASC